MPLIEDSQPPETTPLIDRLDNDPYTILNNKISQIAIGTYQYKLFALCGMGWASDQMYLNSAAILIPQLKLEFKLNGWTLGLPNTCMILGATVGAMCWGYIADTKGRKIPYNWTLVLASIGAIFAALSPNFYLLCVAFFISGIGIGGNLPIDGAIFLEFCPIENQKLLTLLSLFWPLGSVIIAAISLLTMKNNSCSSIDCYWVENVGWRYQMAVLAALTIGMVFLRTFWFQYLESPKSLVARGEPTKAIAVLDALADQNGVGRIETNSIDLQIDMDSVQDKIEFGLQAYRPLFVKDLRITTVLIVLIWNFVAVGYTLFNTFLPELLKGGKRSSSPSTNSFLNYLIVSFFGIPGSVAGMFLADSFIGRKGTMAMSSLGTAAGLFMVAYTDTEFGQLISSCSVSFLQNTMYGVIYSYTPEVFPTAVRGKGVGLASATSRLMSSLAPVAGGILISLGPQYPVMLSCLVIFVSAVMMANLPIETRGQPAM